MCVYIYIYLIYLYQELSQAQSGPQGSKANVWMRVKRMHEVVLPASGGEEMVWELGGERSHRFIGPVGTVGLHAHT